MKSVGAGGSGECKHDDAAAAALARLRAAEREDEEVGEASASPEVQVHEEHPIPEREDEAVGEACPKQTCQPSGVAGAMLTVTPKMGPRSGL